MTVISFINLKGGVAKTVSAINVAYILAAIENKKVLLIDNDKQGNSTKFFHLHDDNAPSIADLLTVKGMDAANVIRRTQYENLDLIPANMSLIRANKEVLMDCSRPQQTRLEKALQGVWDQYDYCIIDNPPDINMGVINALAITDDVIVPVKIDKFTFDGLDELLEQLDDVKEFNPRLNFAGCLITMYYPSDVCTQGREWLEGAEKYKLFHTHIRRTEKVDQSTYAAPLYLFSRWCGASKDYLSFVSEYLKSKNVLESSTFSSTLERSSQHGEI